MNTNPQERFLSADGCHRVLERILGFCTGGGNVYLDIRSEWRGSLRWAQNRIILAEDTTNHEISISRVRDGETVSVVTNSLSDEDLSASVARAEHFLEYKEVRPLGVWPRRTEEYLKPTVWSDATFQVDAATRATLQRKLVEPAMAAHLQSAGYLKISAIGNGVVNSSGLFAYVPQTHASYSVTVRNSKGTGAGWAGTDHHDWRRIDPDTLSAIAMEKCQRSADPVAVEPGRYNTILEPQAVAQLMLPLIQSLDRPPAEWRMGPWADQITPMDPISGGRARFGERVLDPRVTLSADPMDADMPFLPFVRYGEPTRPVIWIDKGVLKALSYDREYALTRLNQQDPLHNTFAFRMAGGTTSLEDMIKSTRRGILVTRFVDVQRLRSDQPMMDASLLCSGRTSDGLWLIENGAISKAVKNFRFRESPLYVFNNLETLGPAVRVLMEQPTIVPSVKVRDFSFTSLSDAV